MTLCTFALALLVSGGTSARAGDSIAAVRAVSSHSAVSRDELSLRRLRPGRQVEVRTNLRVYRLILVDELTGEVRARVSLDQGRTFLPPRRLYVLGATASDRGGMRFTRSGVLVAGLPMELGIGSLHRRDRAVSERLTSCVLIK